MRRRAPSSRECRPIILGRCEGCLESRPSITQGFCGACWRKHAEEMERIGDTPNAKYARVQYANASRHLFAPSVSE